MATYKITNMDHPLHDEDPYNEGPTDEEISAQDKYECEKSNIQYRKDIRDSGRGHLLK